MTGAARRISRAALALSIAALATVAARPVGASDAAPSERAPATEVNKRLTDPTSTTWSLKLENDVEFLDLEGHGTHAQNLLKFQPTMPVVLSGSLKLITRPEFTLLDDKPYVSAQGDVRRTTGVGDTVLDVVLSPRSNPWILGLGPTWVFPTANLDQTGQGTWQAGPGSVAGYRGEHWLAGVIEQQWWSFAGAADRKAVSQMHLQYIASWFFADGWSVGTSPTIKFDWRAAPGDQVTFPFGLSVAKVVKFGDALPVKFQVQGLYVPVRPHDGPQAIIELYVIPVIPSLIAGPVFGAPSAPGEAW